MHYTLFLWCVCKYVYICIFIVYIHITHTVAGVVEYKPSDGEAPVLKLQECEVPLHYQVHSDLDWLYLLGSYVRVK